MRDLAEPLVSTVGLHLSTSARLIQLAESGARVKDANVRRLRQQPGGASGAERILHRSKVTDYAYIEGRGVGLLARMSLGDRLVNYSRLASPFRTQLGERVWLQDHNERCNVE